MIMLSSKYAFDENYFEKWIHQKNTSSIEWLVFGEILFSMDMCSNKLLSKDNVIDREIHIKTYFSKQKHVKNVS